MDIEEQLLLQKSRIKWLSLGDGNNSFFFNQVKSNWHHNKIQTINNRDGIRVFGQSQVAMVAENYFKDTLGTPASTCCQEFLEQTIDTLRCKSVPSQKSAALIQFVSVDLIFSTLKSMKKNKSPGTDGFPAEFYLTCWPIIGKDFCDAIQGFFQNSHMLPAANITSIALIPKTATPSTMQEFRPISLCNIPYKCIAKILANRLKTIMPDIIEQNQSAFVKGRSISDNILLAQESFRGYNRETGTSKCALKLDLHKAFDSVDWKFILTLLKKMQFPLIFINWIEACISTTMYSVKINGMISGFFKGAKGLRQGDPLSPYLFTIAMNALYAILNNKPVGFKHHWRCKDLGINHLFFADDVLLFSNGDKNSINHIMKSVNIFSTISGLIPSIHKSTVFFCNCDSNLMNWFDNNFKMPRGSLPVKFLGVPLISTKLSVNECMPLIDKLTSRLYSWTAILLSFAGRAQLIKAVLMAIQSFWSNHFLLPAAVHKNIQKIFTRFQWKGDIHSTGGVKVSWEQTCLEKNEGGLGIKNPKEWNTAQILAHLCKIITKSSNLWPAWVNATVLKKSQFWTMKEPTYCSWIWRRILGLRSLALRFLKFNLGNGLNTSLWLDPWFKGTCIANNYRDSVISQTGLTANSTVNCIIASGAWILPEINRRLHHSNNDFLLWRQNFDFPVFDLSKQDTICWEDISLKKIKTWQIWDSIRNSGTPTAWSTAIWHKLQVQRDSHHNWLVCLGRLSTKLRLAHFGLQVDTTCLLCVGGFES